LPGIHEFRFTVYVTAGQLGSFAQANKGGIANGMYKVGINVHSKSNSKDFFIDTMHDLQLQQRKFYRAVQVQ
jgi:hypothetical protein